MSMDTREAHAIRVAKALGDPTRFHVLRAIAARDEISCQELVNAFALSQPTVSHHLKILSDAGLVDVRKAGQFHWYRVRADAVAEHARTLSEAFPSPVRSARRKSSRAEPRASLPGGARRRPTTKGVVP